MTQVQGRLTAADANEIARQATKTPSRASEDRLVTWLLNIEKACNRGAMYVCVADIFNSKSTIGHEMKAELDWGIGELEALGYKVDFYDTTNSECIVDGSRIDVRWG